MTARWKGISVLMMAVALGVGVSIGQISLGGAETADGKSVPKELTSYRDVVKKVLPAVVSIQATSKQVSRVNARPSPFADDDLDFFFPFGSPELRKQLEELRRRTPEYTPQRMQFGSGVIIDPQGIVVTNNHVIDGAQTVEVILEDGRKFTSKSVAADPRSDMAIIKLDTTESLPYAHWGDSDSMEIGDRVLAIGAPFQLAGSVTSGIISGKGRFLDERDPLGGIFQDYLQTDAAINPGNSGGPLVNLDGKIVGINTAIRTNTGVFNGVGLAIASNLAQEIVPQLVKGGAVKRGYLGLSMQELTPALVEKLSLEKGEKGLIVGQVIEGGPAAKAGLQQGDVIVRFRGKKIDESRRLQRLVATGPIGEPVEMEVIRDGKRQSLSVTLEAMPDDYGRNREFRTALRNPDAVEIPQIGIEAMTLTDDLAGRLGFNADIKGAVVTSVKSDSVASGSLQAGMVITEIEKEPVRSADELKAAIEKASLEKGILMLVRSPQGGTLYIVLKSNVG